MLAFKEFWPGTVNYLHVTNGAPVEQRPDDYLVDNRLDGYDVLLHNYCARLCFERYVSEDYKRAVRQFKGIKILSVQDEYDRTDQLKAAIRDLKFDIVLTCIPSDQIELVYPKKEFGNVRFISVLTGYVPASAIQAVNPRPLSERPVPVGYRGRNIGVRYGRLGFDKFEIGRRMKAECAKRDIHSDIEMDEASRIYGEGWIEFVRSCRTMLGSESGSNVFDFSGEVATKYKDVLCDDENVETYLDELAPLEKNFDMGQISPRVFECATNFTPMILFEGRYSGALEPYHHYVPLKKDFSNIDEVFRHIDDFAYLEEIASNAHAALIASRRFEYRTFVGEVCQAANQLRQKRGVAELTKVCPPLERSKNVEEMVSKQFPTEMPTPYLRAQIETQVEQLFYTYLPTIAETTERYAGQVQHLIDMQSRPRLERTLDRLKGWVKLVLGIVIRTIRQLVELTKLKPGAWLEFKKLTLWHWQLIQAAIITREVYANFSAYVASHQETIRQSRAFVREHSASLEKIRLTDELDPDDLEGLKGVVELAKVQLRLLNQRRLELLYW